MIFTIIFPTIFPLTIIFQLHHFYNIISPIIFPIIFYYIRASKLQRLRLGVRAWATGIIWLTRQKQV